MYRISFILSVALALTACSTDNVHEFSGASDTETDSGLVDDGPQIYDGFGDEDTGDFGDEDTGEPTEDTGEQDGPQDLDGDGYTQDVDCDETDADINPGATEQCDGIDNDCDGLVDEDLDCESEHVDEDGDYASTFIDCDDTDASVHPGAEEICDDGIDNDCDDLVDDDDADCDSEDTGDTGEPEEDTGTEDTEDTGDTGDTGDAYDPDTTDSDGDGWMDSGDCDPDDASVGSTLTWYEDADEDGYGNADSTESACDQPEGYVEDSTDCDDTDANVNPDAAEAFDDGVDNNCDGEEDEHMAVFIEATYSSTADLDLNVGRYSSGSSMESYGWEESSSVTEGTMVSVEMLAEDYGLSGMCGLRLNITINDSSWYCDASSLDNTSFDIDLFYDGTWYDETDLSVWIASAGSGSCSAVLQTNSDSSCDPVDDE